MKKQKIDDIDIKILKLLEKNSRISNMEISRRIGLSEGAIRKRINKLKKNNIIKGFCVILDYSILGYNVSWIGLNVEKNKIINIIDEIPKDDNIKGIYLTYGDHDIIIEYIYRDKKELENYIKEIKKIEDIKEIWPAINIEKVY
ncbi:HTH-type transcriptional regulator Ptr2 [Nanobdella aerobiophila]|uniref:HTH-type transcriptional regulator Ptr2 n=1 Tax=Nanobdella aerobiophila TaxID=2586965 RepID=A0A915SJY5_9ARCH|nr:Lrp/AsnC family transcriptional regulator [Nanobdella aerobiophila]BBL45323.1 HTH-type transcriptional regulator Ptr2 [Nanobdella aerobiophila]